MLHRKYQTPEILHDAPPHDKMMDDFHLDDPAATLAGLITGPGRIARLKMLWERWRYDFVRLFE